MGSGWVDFPLRKKIKKCKDDQNSPIHPENTRSNVRADSPILF